jgi:hypothetical protein
MFNKVYSNSTLILAFKYAKYQAIDNGKDIKLSSPKPDLRMKSSGQLESLFCMQTALRNRKVVSKEARHSFSTVIKALGLDGWVMYCDGSWATTYSTKPPLNQTNPRARGDGSS